jgi:hypothetical protein
MIEYEYDLLHVSTRSLRRLAVLMADRLAFLAWLNRMNRRFAGEWQYVGHV